MNCAWATHVQTEQYEHCMPTKALKRLETPIGWPFFTNFHSIKDVFKLDMLF